MKISAAVVFMLVAESSAFGVAPRQASSTSLNMGFGVGEAFAITALSGVVGKMTKKREELYASGAMAAVQNDPSPVQNGSSSVAASDPNDVSIPYDAAARLAFAAAGSDGDYAMFKEVYEQQMVAMVIAKKNQREGDVSIPYDAAARLAYTKAGSKGDFSAFKATYEKEAIAMVTAKKAALVK